MVLARILLAVLCAGALAPSTGGALSIQQVQGRGHVSPLLGQDVEGVEGVVTAVLSSGSRRGFFMQDARPGGDGDPWTSDAVFVSTGTAAPMVAPGDAVRVSGRVAEQRGGNDSLAVTQLADASVVVTARGVPLPAPTTIGAAGRAPPARIAPDIVGSVEGPAHRFDPVANAIDFDETLEGMRVRVAGAVAIGPRNSFGEIPILPDLGGGAGLRSARGAMVAGPDGGPAGRLVADDALIGSAAMPRARVGDRLGDAEGVMDYAFAAWRLLLTAPPGLEPGGIAPEVAAPARPGEVSIAAFNVQNLSGASRTAKFASIARQVAGALRAPEILALSEIQDSDGTVDSGTVSAARTYDRLLAAIVAAGGPRYAVAQVDPADGADGGAPGGNIRVAFLYDPARVGFAPRPGGAADVGVGIRADGGLDANPGRIEPLDPAWGSAPDGSDGSRKPLAAEFEVAGRRIVLVAAHLKSKSEDQPDFGRYQSPARHGEAQRLAQAGVIADFVRRLAEADPEAGIAVLGDFNDGGESATLARLAEAGLMDLALTLPPEERYSYVFGGVAEDLDHVLVNAVLHGAASLDIVHANAEFLPSERASDHDPLLARFSFVLAVPEPAPLLALLPAAALALGRARRRACGSAVVAQERGEEGGHRLARQALDALVEGARHGAGLEVELHRARAARDLGDEARGGMDLAAGADRHEEVAAIERGADLVHRERHLAEPHDMRPHAPRAAAGRAGRRDREILLPRRDMAAMAAARLAELAMHVHEAPRACARMQVVDVLRDEQEPARPRALEARQREMRRVGRDRGVAQLRAARVVEFVDACRVAREGAGRRDVLHPHPRPDPVRVAECGEARFAADARAGQDDDRGMARGHRFHCGRRARPLRELTAPPVERAAGLPADFAA